MQFVRFNSRDCFEFIFEVSQMEIALPMLRHKLVGNLKPRQQENSVRFDEKVMVRKFHTTMH